MIPTPARVCHFARCRDVMASASSSSSDDYGRILSCHSILARNSGRLGKICGTPRDGNHCMSETNAANNVTLASSRLPPTPQSAAATVGPSATPRMNTPFTETHVEPSTCNFEAITKTIGRHKPNAKPRCM